MSSEYDCEEYDAELLDAVEALNGPSVVRYPDLKGNLQKPHRTDTEPDQYDRHLKPNRSVEIIGMAADVPGPVTVGNKAGSRDPLAAGRSGGGSVPRSLAAALATEGYTTLGQHATLLGRDQSFDYDTGGFTDQELALARTPDTAAHPSAKNTASVSLHGESEGGYQVTKSSTPQDCAAQIRKDMRGKHKREGDGQGPMRPSVGFLTIVYYFGNSEKTCRRRERLATQLIRTT